MRLLRLILIGFVLSMPLFVFAQSENIDLKMIQRIKEEGLTNSGIRDISFFLTDVVGPRLSGSEGMNRAYEYTSRQMSDWGLSNVQVVPWGEFGVGWENEKFYIAMTKPYYQHLIAVPRAWTRGTQGLVSASPVLVDIRSEQDLAKYRGKLRGKVVVTPVTNEPVVSFNPMASRYSDQDLENIARLPDPRSPSFGNPVQAQQGWDDRRNMMRRISEFFEEEGVVAVLHASGNFGTVRSGGSGYAVGADRSLPQIDMTFEHYGRIVRLLEAGIEVSLDLDVANRFIEDDIKGYNVIAEIPGTDRRLKEQVVLIGGHLDSWHAGTGGNDNAAGVAVMMEAIRILKAIGVQPRRTIRIALWGAEEQGLFGSRGYVSEHYFDRTTREKKADYDKLSAYFNVDNGSGMIRGIWLMGNDAARPIFEELLKPFHDMGATTVTLRNTGGSDHTAFNSVGLPGFNFLQDRIDYGRGYHTNMDTFERMQLGDMMQAAVVVAGVVYHVAMRDEMIPRKAFDPEAIPSRGR